MAYVKDAIQQGKLPKLMWGPRKLREWAGQVVDVEDGRQPIAGRGISIKEDVSGRIISAGGDGAGSASVGRPGGFKCVRLGDRIRVHLGLVNNKMPSGFVTGDINPFTIAPAGSSGFVMLEVIVSEDDEDGDSDGVPDGSIVSASIVTSFHALPDDEPKFYLAIGTYGTDGSGLLVTPGGAGDGVGDQRFELCGGLGGAPQWGPA